MLPWELHEFTEDCEIVKATFIPNQTEAELSYKVKQTKYAAASKKIKGVNTEVLKGLNQNKQNCKWCNDDSK